MRKRLVGSFLLLLLAAIPAVAGDFVYSPITGDADTGINSGLVYTAKADFNGSGARTVNGVLFSDTGETGTDYALSGTGGTYTGFGNNVTGETGGMLSDFRYTNDSSGNASLTLTGLTIGQQYMTSWYCADFGDTKGRKVNITPSDTGTAYLFSEDYLATTGNGSVLRYVFTATNTSITYGFDAVSDGDSFHHYAFSNAVQDKSLLTTPVVTAVSGAGPFSPFAPSNDDLLQTNLASVSSSGTFTTEGAGGVPILNDGAFVINGGNPADNSALATGGNGASVTFYLDTAAHALGYDVTSIVGYGGWNDAGRDRQLYKISVSYVGSDDFVYLGAVDYNPADAPSDPSAVRAAFETDLTGVDALQIDFFGEQENGYAGYGEFDVIGSATVPEPSVLVLAICGLLGCLAVRRVRGR